MEHDSGEFARFLATEGALFFGDNLRLKDGRPTPYFVNFGVFKKGSRLTDLGSFYMDMLLRVSNLNSFDVLVGPSYKGSMIVIATALTIYRYEPRFDIAVDYDRKEAKTHGEASGRGQRFVTGAFYDGARSFVLDDVGTSMSTKYELVEKIEAEAREKGWKLPIVGVGLGVDREQTEAVYDAELPQGLSDKDLSKWKKEHVILGVKGEDALAKFTKDTGIKVYAVSGIRGIVDSLCKDEVPVLINGKRKPIDEQVRAEFERYMETYGRP